MSPSIILNHCDFGHSANNLKKLVRLHAKIMWFLEMMSKCFLNPNGVFSDS